MYRIRLIFLMLVCFFILNPVFADDFSDLMLEGIGSIHQAYNDWDETEFKKSLSLFEKASQMGQEEGLAEYWSGTAYFFLSLHNLFSVDKQPDKTLGAEYARKGIEILSRSIDLSPAFSESYAIRGVLRGILIKLKPLSVFSQGSKVGKDREIALELDENNPRVHYLTGVSFLFAPEILGGSEKALEHLLKAEQLFEEEEKDRKDSLMPFWGQSACLSFIGNFYYSEGRYDEASIYYKKALQINPRDPLALKGMNNLNM